jgi:ribosomal protein S18 acetylase RimI-like enzyme
MITLTQSGSYVAIRTWKQADLDYITESIQREGWGHARRDVERCWSLEPKGCFVAESNSRLVGHVFSVLFGEIGWIGLLIVNPEKRGRGVGTALMEAAINSLETRGARTIKLEAVPEAAPLYRRLGFSDVLDSLRFHGVPQGNRRKARRNETLPVTNEADIDEIAEFDARCFGANRLSVLRSLHHDFPQYCFYAKGNQGTTGYIMARKTLDGLWLGPWVCIDSRVAELLFNRLLEAIEKETKDLRLGLPAVNASATRLVEKHGFRLVGKSIHMIRGDMKNQGDVTCIYGIGGPEKG